MSRTSSPTTTSPRQLAHHGSFRVSWKCAFANYDVRYQEHVQPGMLGSGPFIRSCSYLGWPRPRMSYSTSVRWKRKFARQPTTSHGAYCFCYTRVSGLSLDHQGRKFDINAGDSSRVCFRFCEVNFINLCFVAIKDIQFVSLIDFLLRLMLRRATQPKLQ